MADLACPTCSRPLPLHLADDGQVKCSYCGAVCAVADDPLDDNPEATIDAPAPALPAYEPLPAGFKSPFSSGFLEQYQIIGFLGKGAMGAVYLMRQVKLDRLVAVKVVREDVLSAEESRRLEREARTLAQLNHPNIVALYDVGYDGAVPFMVTEFVEGETLSKRLIRKPVLTLPQALRVTLSLLDGLKAAHKKGVVHRDLKPGNIFLTGSLRPKIGDFGLAKAQTVSSGTLVGKILGTPAYMSPEQCRGSATTQASDIYAIGVILFEMAAGKRPFHGPETLDYLTQHTTDPAPPVRQFNRDLPEELEKILLKALAKDPGRRFDSARTFRKDLLDLFRTVSPSQDAPSSKSTPKAPQRKSSEMGAGALLANRYRVLRQLGEGGMGQVWLGADEAIDGTEVALKILPPDLWRDTEARETLKQEAKLSQKLAHPNIVRLMTLEPGDPSFLVMEFVSGPTLAAELALRKRRGMGAFTAQEALPILEGLASGLDHAHQKNLVHRDLKPSNVLLDPQPDGTFVAKLADFGIAAELTNYRTRQTGAVPAGTLAYMSPEQLACQKLDARADVYSLGATLYQMLTLRPPFVGGDIAWAIRNEPVPEPTEVPEGIRAVLFGALAKKPDERPASAGALAARFREAVDVLTGASYQTGPTGRLDGRSDDRRTGSASGSSQRPTQQVAAMTQAGADPRRGGGGAVAPLHEPIEPWTLEAYGLAMVGSLSIMLLWFHAGWLMEGRFSPGRAGGQLALAVAAVLGTGLALHAGRNLVRRGLSLAHAALLVAAVAAAANSRMDLFFANLGVGALGLALLEHPLSRAFATGAYPAGADPRSAHRRGLAVALALPLMVGAALVIRLHVQSLAPDAVPEMAWRQDPGSLGDRVLANDGSFGLRPPRDWAAATFEPQPAGALGFVFRAGGLSPVGALSIRRVARRKGDAPGDVSGAQGRIRRFRRRFHVEIDRVGLVPLGPTTWVECTGRYQTRAGTRALWYAETVRDGQGYELEFYGLPAFVSANRGLFAKVLESVEFRAGGGVPAATGSRAALAP